MQDIAQTRHQLQRFVQRADKNPADFDIACEVSEKIEDLCGEVEGLLQSGQLQEALNRVWLVADELVLHYEILEETDQVFESFENWAITAEEVIEAIDLTPGQKQAFQQQFQSWEDLLNGYEFLREAFQPLISIVNER